MGRYVPANKRALAFELVDASHVTCLLSRTFTQFFDDGGCVVFYSTTAENFDSNVAESTSMTSDFSRNTVSSTDREMYCYELAPRHRRLLPPNCNKSAVKEIPKVTERR